MQLALSAVREGAKIILVEKPLSAPNLSGAQELFDEADKFGCNVFVGYDHAISKSASLVYDALIGKSYGLVQTLDVEFREFWGGIFKAHPWLNGPSDSYLGFWEKGGGSCGEHSHAINLFQNFAHKSNIGRVVEVSAFMDYVENDKLSYDSNCLMSFRTEKNIVGRVVQDVLTQPTRKWARIQCEDGFLEWHCGNKPGIDTVVRGSNNGESHTEEIIKTRPDDFYEEMQHIMLAINDHNIYKESPISLKKGLETMLVIAAAHLSAKNKRVVSIDYSSGFTLDALSFLT
jgi:predicted dehydrogenase